MKKIVSAIITLAMIASMFTALPAFADTTGETGDTGDTSYTAPASPAVTYNMNVDWKFKKASGTVYPLASAQTNVAKNGKQFYEIDYDDSDWENVSVPHPINAEDTFDGAAMDSGEQGYYRGFMFYRKHVTIPAADAGKKLFLEFEAVRQSVYLWVNGEMVGYYEAGIAPIGFDITDYVTPGADNVIAVATDNSASRGNTNETRETKPGSTPGAADGNGYQWNTADFNEVQGGITGNVNLYAKSKVYQTLPLYNNLKTTGNYIYGSDYDIDAKSATINVKAEVRNESGTDKNVKLRVDVVDMEGKLAYTNETAAQKVETVDGVLGSYYVTAGEALTDAQPIFAVYGSDNRLRTVAFGKQITCAKDAKIEVKIPASILSANVEGTTLKKFVWDSASGMKPMNVTFEDGNMTVEHFMNMVPADAYESDPKPTDISTVDVSYITASFKAENMRFWSDKDPYMYTVYTSLIDEDGNVLDSQKEETGFRKVDYNINDGLLINDKTVYLKGYAQRATNEWAVVGTANDWLTDVDMQLLKESNGNHIRWMHVAPKPVEVRATDKYGILVTCPAGDKEGDTDGRAWDQRVEAMRDAMIYFRNNPSVLFWEAGNNTITPAHMQEMTDLKAELDPYGGRFTGSRTISSKEQIEAAEYVGTMLNRHASDAKASMAAADDKYMPIMETEYARDEAPRRVWDDYSPPDYDYKNWWLNGANKVDGYDMWDETSEDFSVANAKAYNEFWSGRVTGGGDELYAGAAIMVWSDSNMHNRNTHSENCRTSGKVDPVRQKKDAFYTMQTIQSDEPAVHIVGHWNYPEYIKDDRENGNYWYEDKTLKEGNPTHWEPNGTYLQRDPTKKTVYVIGSPDVVKVELYINDELQATDVQPESTFVYAFPNIDVSGASGEIKAIAYNERDIEVAEDVIKTAGEPDHIKLTPVTGPDGLIADGSDVMYFDVEIVDENDNVCPLDYSKLDLKLSGNGVLLGGYTSGVGELNTTHKDYTYAECGTNRIFVRSTRTAGPVTLSVTNTTLGTQEATVNSVAFDNKVGSDTGLSTTMQRAFKANEKPPVVEQKVEAFKPLAAAVQADFTDETGNTKVVEKVDTTVYYTVTVNGTELTLEGDLRAEESSMDVGVFGPVSPLFAKLAELGAVESYSVEGTPKVLTFKAGGHTYTVREGENAIHSDIDDNPNGTEIIENTVVKGGDLFANYEALLTYIPGAEGAKDDTEHTYAITYTTPVQGASLDGIELMSLDGDIALTANASDYEEEVLNLDFASKTDGILKPTATESNAFGKDMGATLAKESRISFDFRFDVATITDSEGKDVSPTIRFTNSHNKTGPFFSFDGTNFRTQTGSSSYQNLGAIEVGKWYRFEIEGTMAIANASAKGTLYSLETGSPVLVQATSALNLRNFANDTNYSADRLEVTSGISMDNIKISSLYADTVEVTAPQNSINAKKSLSLSAVAKRGTKVVAAPEFTWSLHKTDGSALNDPTVSIENGLLSTTKDTATQDIKVRATAQSKGNPYGEFDVHIEAIDTSNDKFNSIELSSDQEYVRIDEPATISLAAKLDGADYTPQDGEVIWTVLNEAGIRELGNTGITVENGVVSVTEDVIPQTITVMASNESGSTDATIQLKVKPANMLDADGSEQGNLDTYVSGNACEEFTTNMSLELNDDSWDGSGYYKVTAATDFVGFPGNTGENVLYSADMKFGGDGAGWTVWDSGKGKQGLQITAQGDKLGIVEDSKKTPTYCTIDNDSWYNVQIMCATGISPNSYANLIVYKYVDGKRVNPETGEEGKPYVKEGVPMRNLSESQANHIVINPNTCVDNVYCIKTTPDKLELSLTASEMFAGQTLQGTVTATRKGVKFGYISSDLIRWVVYDAENEAPLDTDLITVDKSGKLTVDALADAQTVYLRVQTLDGSLHDSKPVTIKTSDIFEVKTIGFNEDYSAVTQLDVNKNFAYSDSVTFMVVVYEKDTGKMVSASTRKMSAKNIARNNGEDEPVAIPMNAPMPADFKAKNADGKYDIWVYTMTADSENDAVTEGDGSITASITDNTLTLTALPEFDEGKPVILMVVKPETVTTSVKDDDILYIKQFTGETIKELQSVTIDASAAGDYIIKAAGKIDGVSAIKTGIVTKENT